MSGRSRVPAEGALPPGQGATTGWPVLHVGEVPDLDRERWRLRIHGAVETPFELDWPGLLALPATTVTADMHCVTGWSRFANRWQGVRLAELLRRASPRPEARFVRFADAGVYDTTVPLARAMGEDALLAYGHDGAPLTPEHGGPVRAVVPGLYAWKSCKWVCTVELLASDRLGFWERRGYHNDADPWREERFV